MSDGYISRQRIDTSLLKNEKTAFKLVVKLIQQNFFHQIDLATHRIFGGYNIECEHLHVQ